MIFGRKGTGKSDLARYLFMLFGTRYRNGGRVLIDSKDEHSESMPGVPTFDSPSEVFQAQTVRLVPPDPTDDKWFDEVYRLLFEAGDCVLWNEELNSFTSPGKAPKWTKIYIYQGRVRKCGFLGTNQRPAEQQGCFLSMADHVISYALRYKLDREAVARHMGVKNPDEFDDLLDQLVPFGFLHYDVEHDDLSSSAPIHDPEALTAEISRLYFGPYDSR